MHALVHAADIQDRDGGMLVMRDLFGLYPFLLKLYAEREMQTGHTYGRPGELFAEFEADFPYDETPDQARAIEEVLEGRSSGIGTIVEMTPTDPGRDPAGLRAVAEATGVPISNKKLKLPKSTQSSMLALHRGFAKARGRKASGAAGNAFDRE